jgi:hypothetical protein
MTLFKRLKEWLQKRKELKAHRKRMKEFRKKSPFTYK